MVFRRMVRSMYRLKRKVGEEGAVSVRLAVQILNELIGVIEGRIEVLRQLNRLAVLEPGGGSGGQVMFGLPIVRATFQQRHRTLEALRAGQTLRPRAKVPFAGHVGPIARIAQQGRQGDGPVVEPGFIAGLALLIVGHDLLHVAHADLVAGNTGHQHGPGWRAGGGNMKIAELQTRRGQRIDIRRTDLTAIDAGIRETHIVGDNQQDIRTRVGLTG